MKILPLFPSSVFMDFVEEDTDELKEYDGDFFVTEFGDGNKVSDDRRILENYPRIKKLLMKKFNKVSEFNEKDRLQEGWINGGFFILNKNLSILISIKIKLTI